MKTFFDKIYVISLISNKDRQEFIKYQFNKIGLNFEFIYGVDFFNFENKDFKWPDLLGYLKNSPKSLGCAVTHYQAIMQAYYLGFNNVLIIEDDVCLNKDIYLLENMWNNIPQDADFITYDYRNWRKYQNKYINLINQNLDKNYVEIDDGEYFAGGAMYALMNRKIMKIYMNQQHNFFTGADTVMGIFNREDHYSFECKRYVSTKCLFVDQYNYEKVLINNDYSEVYFMDNLHLIQDENLQIKKYCKNNFFKPTKFSCFTRY